MILKTNVWKISYNKSNQIDRESGGKWLVYDKISKMKKWLQEIDKLVDEGTIYMAKYSHKENPYLDNLPFNKPVMCVYADDETKYSTRNELSKLGIEPEEWKYDEETNKDWGNGGKLIRESHKQGLIQFMREMEKKDN